MSEPIEFSTDRLLLRQWRDADREPFARMSADPRVMEFFPNLLDRAESDAMVTRMQSLIADRGWGFWAVELKREREFIGFVGLHAPALDLPFAPCVEVGWRLAHAYWGGGYATEAARGALKLGFETLALAEIVSFTALTNRRSQAVMARLKMQRATDTFLHPRIPPQHRLAEHCLYRLSRQDWQQTEKQRATDSLAP